MKDKKNYFSGKYDFNSIYFGSLVYNSGNNGYYYSYPVALQKIEEGYYKKLGKNMMMKAYEVGTAEFLTVTNVVPLSSLTDNNGKEVISDTKIMLHLVKYCLNSKNREVMLFKEIDEQYKKQYCKRKNK